MRFVPLPLHLPANTEWPAGKTIPCCGIGLPDTELNLKYRWVWHWDIHGIDKFGSGFSISEYDTGYNITWGNYTLDDAVREAVNRCGLVLTAQNWERLKKVNDPANYFMH